MKNVANSGESRKKIRYVGSIGFKRRMRWTRSFVVAVHRVESCGVCA